MPQQDGTSCENIAAAMTLLENRMTDDRKFAPRVPDLRSEEAVDIGNVLKYDQARVLWALVFSFGSVLWIFRDGNLEPLETCNKMIWDTGM